MVDHRLCTVCRSHQLSQPPLIVPCGMTASNVVRTTTHIDARIPVRLWEAAMNNPSSNEPSAVGVCDNLEKPEHVIEELRRAGFQSEEIGIIGHVGPDEKVSPPREMHTPEENAISGFLRGRSEEHTSELQS